MPVDGVETHTSHRPGERIEVPLMSTGSTLTKMRTRGQGSARRDDPQQPKQRRLVEALVKLDSQRPASDHVAPRRRCHRRCRRHELDQPRRPLSLGRRQFADPG